MWKTVGTKTLTLTVTAPEEKKGNAGMFLLGAAIGLALLSRSGEKR